MLLFPFLCGIGLTVLHLKLCRPFTPRQVMFHTFFIYFVGWWFFTSGYKQSIYCMWGVIIYLVTTVCSKRAELPDGSETPAGLLPAEATAALPADAAPCGKVEGEGDCEECVAR